MPIHNKLTQHQTKEMERSRRDGYIALIDYPHPLRHKQYKASGRNIIAVYYTDERRPYGVHTTTTLRKRELRIFKTFDVAIGTLCNEKKMSPTSYTIVYMDPETPSYESFLERVTHLLATIYGDIHAAV